MSEKAFMKNMFGSQGKPEEIQQGEEIIAAEGNEEYKEKTEERVDGLEHKRSTGNYEIPKTQEELYKLLKEEMALRLQLNEIKDALRGVPEDILPTEGLLEIRGRRFLNADAAIKYFEKETGITINPEIDLKNCFNARAGSLDMQYDMGESNFIRIMNKYGWTSVMKGDELMMIKIADHPVPGLF